MMIAESNSALLHIATDLINIPSVTGSERAVLEYLEEMLVGMQLVTHRETVEQDRWNLYAGWTDTTDVVFCTHVDTVPPFIPADVHGDILSGRGSCDTKGIIASMIMAGYQLLADGFSPAYLFVVGEETDSIGAKTAAASGRKANFFIVGEPTDNILATGHKGVVSYTLKAAGRAAHSAYPENGSSAIHLLLDVLEKLRRADWGSSPVLGEATMNVGLISGGVAMNTLAPDAAATVIHRIVDDSTQRRQQVLDIVAGYLDVEFHSTSEPQLLTTVPGFPQKAVSFGTDIPYLSAMGRCLLYGPGSIHDAHTPNEKNSVTAMNTAVESYIQLFHALRRS
ncbi:MAG: M20/M25/M40 family metallo-hydrolase [Bacteroidetes bacterium]|nr:M20/M25/M40 family metallo-hydrolase [Bacteroidota bacterium]